MIGKDYETALNSPGWTEQANQRERARLQQCFKTAKTQQHSTLTPININPSQEIHTMSRTLTAKRPAPSSMYIGGGSLSLLPMDPGLDLAALGFAISISNLGASVR